MDPMSRTVPAMLRHWATVNPHTPAFIYVDAVGGRHVLTCSDVFRFSSRYAAILRRNGVKSGTTVCNTLPNSPERLLTDLGIILAGGVAMNGQLFLADGEDFVGNLKDSEAFAVILDPKNPNGAAKVLEKRAHSTEECGQLKYPEMPALKRVFEVHFERGGLEKRPLLRVLETEQESFVADVTPRDTALIFTTSGSTGFSKLVPWSHENVLALGDDLYESLDHRPGEVIYNDWSQGWAVGFPNIFLAHGVTRVLLDVSAAAPENDIAFIWDVIRRERCSLACLSAQELIKITNLWHREQQTGKTLWQLRVIVSSGQPYCKTHMLGVGKITKSVLVVYGSTETGIMSTKLVTSSEDYEDCNSGTPLSGVKMRVVNAELQDQPVENLGEILVRTSHLFDRYVNNEEATQRAFTEDGWYKTGDMGYFNDKGEIYTVCRSTYSIMRGSFLLYPGWLERRIRQCPGVEQIMIVPVPDPLIFQELCACVVTRPGAQLTSEGLTEFCKTLFLTSEEDEMTAVPKYYLFFDALPTTNTGKTSRRATEAVAKQRLGLEG
ncbi:putative acyl--CoA ligase YdaB [Littorina saxatilis]|uniref:Medium-chain acyl-CoA ligase ACSF2, mitochondrial n=1 Tax=Littorina saxatilis TaxID=31220 RepID=A0AAN9GHP5_9CAEN